MNYHNIKYLAWLDLEMTGLHPTQDVILEIATVITDVELNIIAYGPELILAADVAALNNMTPYVLEMHTKSNLINKVKNSTITTDAAAEQTLEFLSKYLAKGESPLCGNSIGLDRRFLIEHMPTLADYFHYRNLDVSTLKILANIWQEGEGQHEFQKHNNHRALDDVLESINELKHYREHLFKI